MYIYLINNFNALCEYDIKDRNIFYSIIYESVIIRDSLENYGNSN